MFGNIVLRERFAVAPITSPLICLGRILQDGVVRNTNLIIWDFWSQNGSKLHNFQPAELVTSVMSPLRPNSLVFRRKPAPGVCSSEIRFLARKTLNSSPPSLSPPKSPVSNASGSGCTSGSNCVGHGRCLGRSLGLGSCLELGG